MHINNKDNEELYNIRHVLLECADIRSKNKVLFIADSNTLEIAEKFIKETKLLNEKCEILFEIIKTLSRHGEEPSSTISEKMLAADITLCLSTFSLAHTTARLNAQKLGRYFLSMPLYTIELLRDPSLAVDYKKQAPLVEFVAQKFTNGYKIHLTSGKGTDLHLNINGRIGNVCPGFVSGQYYLGSPPDIEANISPNEESSFGILIIDGSITCPQIGLLKEEVIFELDKGLIENISSKNMELQDVLKRIFFDGSYKKRILAEFGVGLNPLAKLTGSMLTDEGSLGTIHCGFGSNSTVGGCNKIDFHLDCVIKDPNILVYNKLLMDRGNIIYD